MKQKLITKAVERLLEKHPLYSQEGEGYNAVAWVKFFLPAGKWTWYVTEAEKRDGDWLFFGAVVSPYEVELGYFTLSELSQTFSMPVSINGVRMNFPMKVERDKYFEPTKLCECSYIKDEIIVE